VRSQLDAEVNAHRHTRQRLLRQLYEMSAPFPARGGSGTPCVSKPGVSGGRASAGRGKAAGEDDTADGADGVESAGHERAGHERAGHDEYGDGRGHGSAQDSKGAADTPEQRAPASPTASTSTDGHDLELHLQQQQRTHSRLLSQVSELRQAALADARLLADAERRRAVEQSQWKVSVPPPKACVALLMSWLCPQARVSSLEAAEAQLRDELGVTRQQLERKVAELRTAQGAKARAEAARVAGAAEVREAEVSPEWNMIHTVVVSSVLTLWVWLHCRWRRRSRSRS
jgi:hypothetical protein